MPRPGPRPYECVRRAWHSDRHQPIRGSIIQQIFRVVNVSHSTATKGNREWQEKLPLVVFKAEEIMYSRSNSEVEYTDLETLWDRIKEAINFIIRKDDNTETGDLLPPPVEAALNLGCLPVRASRSQRHSNPRSYLSPRNQDSVSVPPQVLDNPIQGRVPTSRPTHYANQPIEERPRTMNLSNSFSNPNIRAIQNNRTEPSTSGRFSSAYENYPSQRKKQFISMEGDTSANVGHTYPLHTGTHFEADVSRIAHADSRDKQLEAEATECDLSLRRGLFSGPCLIWGKGSTSH